MLFLMGLKDKTYEFKVMRVVFLCGSILALITVFRVKFPECGVTIVTHFLE